jgi:hypothetical protein
MNISIVAEDLSVSYFISLGHMGLSIDQNHYYWLTSEADPRLLREVGDLPPVVAGD